MTTHRLLLDVPSIPHGPKNIETRLADANYYLEAAGNIRWQARRGESFAGSNLTETVARLCIAAADALKVDPAVPASTARHRERSDTGAGNAIDQMTPATHEFILVRRLEDGTVRIAVHVPDSSDMLRDGSKLLNDGLEKLAWGQLATVEAAS